VRAAMRIRLWRAGFVYDADPSYDGMSFFVRRAAEDNKQPPLFFIHGVGLGLVPYMSWLMNFIAPLSRTLVLVEAPTHSHGVHQEYYPTAMQMALALERKLRQLSPTNERCACDVIGYSYGSMVAAYWINAFTSVRRFVLIDPVCFCYFYDTYFASEPVLSKWLALGNVADWFVKGNIGTQQCVKKTLNHFEQHLYPPSMGSQAMLILSGQDSIVRSSGLSAFAQEYWPEANVHFEKQWEHGEMFLMASPAVDRASRAALDHLNDSA